MPVLEMLTSIAFPNAEGGWQAMRFSNPEAEIRSARGLIWLDGVPLFVEVGLTSASGKETVDVQIIEPKPMSHLVAQEFKTFLESECAGQVTFEPKESGDYNRLFISYPAEFDLQSAVEKHRSETPSH